MQLQIDCLMAVVGFDHECLEKEVSVGALFLCFPFTLFAPNSNVFLCFSPVFTTSLSLILRRKSSSPHIFLFFNGLLVEDCARGVK